MKGYCQLPFMKGNENWIITKLLDGFKSHKNALQAHKICADQLIVTLKEESNSSHVNQGYNQLTAKNDKKNAASHFTTRAGPRSGKQERVILINIILF